MFRKTIFIAVALLFAGTLSEAQYKPRPVTGIVTDKRGNTLPGAVVQIENENNFKVRSYIIHKDGRFYFDNLNDDVDYRVRAHYRNYWSEPKTLSKFNTSPHPEVDLVIPID